MNLQARVLVHSKGGICMFFLLPALAVVVETAAATTLGTIAAGSTTTALNVGIVEAGKSLLSD